MARKNTQPTPTQTSKSNVKPTWGGYINIDLTPEQKNELSENIHADNTLLLETLAEMLQGGKITVSLAENGAVTVTYTREYSGKLWALSAFASTFDVALQVLDYKCYAYPSWFIDGKPQIDKGLFG